MRAYTRYPDISNLTCRRFTSIKHGNLTEWRAPLLIGTIPGLQQYSYNERVYGTRRTGKLYPETDVTEGQNLSTCGNLASPLRSYIGPE